MAFEDMKPNPPGVMEKNNKLMMSMDKKRESKRIAQEKKKELASKIEKAKGGKKYEVGDDRHPMTKVKDASGAMRREQRAKYR